LARCDRDIPDFADPSIEESGKPRGEIPNKKSSRCGRANLKVFLKDIFHKFYCKYCYNYFFRVFFASVILGIINARGCVAEISLFNGKIDSFKIFFLI
jgi:hypothetical protein